MFKIFWRKWPKVWLKFGSKLKKMAQKNQIGENDGERKKNPGANPADHVVAQVKICSVRQIPSVCQTTGPVRASLN